MKTGLSGGERCEASVGYGNWGRSRQCNNRATKDREEVKHHWGLSDKPPTVRMRRVCGTHARTKYGVSFVPTAEEQRWSEANETWRIWKKHEQRAEEQLAQARAKLHETGLAECPECSDTCWRTDLEQHRLTQHGVPTAAMFWDDLYASLDAATA